MQFYRHDPEGFLNFFFNQHSIPQAYTHCTYLGEEVYKRDISLQEVKSNWKKEGIISKGQKPREMEHEDFIHGNHPLQTMDEEEQQESAWTNKFGRSSQ